MWSYGCLIICVYRRKPFAFCDEDLGEGVGLHSLSSRLRDGRLRPHFLPEDALHAELGQLTRACCTVDADERPHIGEVLVSMEAAMHAAVC